MAVTEAELQEALKSAWSLKDDQSRGTYIGTVKNGNRLTVLYKDNSGGYWYETKYQEAHGIVTEYEHVFGHPEHKTKGNNGKWKKSY